MMASSLLLGMAFLGLGYLPSALSRNGPPPPEPRSALADPGPALRPGAAGPAACGREPPRRGPDLDPAGDQPDGRLPHLQLGRLGGRRPGDRMAGLAAGGGLATGSLLLSMAAWVVLPLLATVLCSAGRRSSHVAPKPEVATCPRADRDRLRRGATAEAPPPAERARAIGYYCKMIVQDHQGPKGQIFLSGSAEPIWFSSVRDTLAFTRLPEEPKNVAAIYVSDMGRASWTSPEAGTWIAAEQAWCVIGSERQGGMGAPRPCPSRSAPTPRPSPRSTRAASSPFGDPAGSPPGRPEAPHSPGHGQPGRHVRCRTAGTTRKRRACNDGAYRPPALPEDRGGNGRLGLLEGAAAREPSSDLARHGARRPGHDPLQHRDRDPPKPCRARPRRDRTPGKGLQSLSPGSAISRLNRQGFLRHRRWTCCAC